MQESPKEETTLRKDALEIPTMNMSKRGSLTSAKSLHELKHDASTRRDDSVDSKLKPRKEDESSVTAKGIRPSKSDTSLTESFVVIDAEYNKRNGHNALREGKCHQR